MGGRSDSFAASGDSQVVVSKLDDQGNALWSRYVGVDGDFDAAAAVLALEDGAVIVGGFTEDQDGDSDWLLGRMEGTGDLGGGACDAVQTVTLQSAVVSLASRITNGEAIDTQGALEDTTRSATTAELTGRSLCP